MYQMFKEWLALKIVSLVGTMECAFIFALLSLTSLPAAIHGGIATTVSWTAQTFLQLVLLSVIMVGQELQQRRHADTQRSLDDLHDKHDALHSHFKMVEK